MYIGADQTTALQLLRWFRRSVSHSFIQGTTVVEGAQIRWRAWGDPGAPVVVLVHGGAAHGGWWNHVGPHLASGRRVIAVDLSGHGDSDRRPQYKLDIWMREVLAVAAEQSSAPPHLIGHSMGGHVVLRAVIDLDVEVASAVVIDAPVEPLGTDTIAEWERRSTAMEGRWYESRADILERFRPLPADVSLLDYIVRYVGDQSVREVDGRWTWKFDPRMYAHGTLTPDRITESRCELLLLNGERGMVDTVQAARTQSLLGKLVTVATIPDCGHHIMLERPIALVGVLDTVLALRGVPSLSWSYDADLV